MERARPFGPDGIHGNHFRRLDVANRRELWRKAERRKKEKGLGYPILTQVPKDETEQARKGAGRRCNGRNITPPSIRGDEQRGPLPPGIWRRAERGAPADPFAPIVFPPGLRNLPPREAALALTDANRTIFGIASNTI